MTTQSTGKQYYAMKNNRVVLDIFQTFLNPVVQAIREDKTFSGTWDHGIISTNVFSTYRDGTQIGEAEMIVIDSETGEYEKIEVMGKTGYKGETVSAIDD